MICIVSVFKNEGHAIREWLDHYIKEGVDTFFLTDNGSTDTYDIQDYIENGKVVLRKDPKKHAQNDHLNYYLKDAKKYDWVIVVDLDEFIYSRLGFKTMKDYLKTVPKDIYLIKLPWKIFGSNGHIKQPKSIIKGFTRRKKNKERCYIDNKSIARGDKIIELNIHTPIVKDINPWNHQTMTSKKNMITHMLQVDEKVLETSYLHLNHYRIQSWQFYKNVKMKRGDAINTKKNRNKQDFKLHDLNEQIDKELKNKRY